MDISLGQDSVTVNMNLALTENLTTSLPLIKAHINTGNSTDQLQAFLQPINSAMEKRVATARVSSFDAVFQTSISSGTWLLEENYSMVVEGINTNTGSNIRSNLGFIAMNLTQSLYIGGTELNAVGQATLLPALQEKTANYSNLKYFIDGSNPRTALIPEETTKGFWMLDFTWVGEVSTWKESSDLLAQSTEWTLDPLAPQYNLTLTLPSPEGLVLKSFVAIYNPSLRITVPANAWVQGNIISFDTSTLTELVMPSIILISLIAAIATMLLDRKVARPTAGRKRR